MKDYKNITKNFKKDLDNTSEKFSKNAIILMTALLPTTGHADLIRFASQIPDTKVHILVNGRSFEPHATELRVEDLQKHFESYPNVVVRGSVKDKAPQNPEEMSEGFWSWWKNEINQNFPEVYEKWDYVVASEPYGLQVAESLNASFLPFDLNRERNPARGTDVRSEVWICWNQLLPETRQRLLMKAVMFGQESVGKTTLTKMVSEKLKIDAIPEYARPYLETVGIDVDDAAMANIHAGQAALQSLLYLEARTPAVVMDTDLYSTIGYYSIMLEKTSESILKDAERLAADVYYVLPDSIPFEEDPLRYGGDHRESDLTFWTDLLKSYNREFVIVPDGNADEKTEWITADILERFNDRVSDLASFQRS